MNTKMKCLKALLKRKATEIRNTRNETKEYQRKHGGSCGGRQWTLIKMREDYRNYHIAYSELRGKTIDQIEPNCYKDRNTTKIDSIKEEYHEDVCISA